MDVCQMLQKQYREEEIRQESKIDFLIDTARHLYSKEYSIEQVCEILRIDEAEAEIYRKDWLKNKPN